MKILVLGYIVRMPIGGMTWHYLHYVLGLSALGHDVYFLEDSDDFDGCCYDPRRQMNVNEPDYGLAYTEAVFDAVGLSDRWGYYDCHTGRWHGPVADEVADVIAGADMLINISGSNRVVDWFDQIPVRALIDTDPAFEQIRQVTVPERRELVDAHTCFFTFGSGVAARTARVPDDGRDWMFTRQPLDLRFWPEAALPAEGAYTTVMQWDSYTPREYDGLRYGMKSTSFAPYIDFAKKTGQAMELALSGAHAPMDDLCAGGWHIRHGPDVTADIWTYRDYLRGSRGEFAIAKQGYVVSRCGWFSERSAAYLACGRPVIAQSTGYEEWLPTGEGLLSFDTPETAAAAIAEVERDYPRHAAAARAIAEDHFAAGPVLTDMLERCHA